MMVVDEKVRWSSLRPSADRRQTKMVFLFVLSVAVLCCSAVLFAQQSSDAESAAAPAQRYRVFSFRHISASQAKAYLEKAAIAVDSQIVKDNIISITASQQNLARAAEVLRLVDSQKPFEVKTLVPAAPVSGLPSADQISSRLGNIKIGSFASPPVGAVDKAIIDVSGDSVLIIAPLERIKQIEQLLVPASAFGRTEGGPALLADQNQSADADMFTLNSQPEKVATNYAKEDTNGSDLLDAAALLKINSSGLPRTGAKKVQVTDANVPVGSDANDRQLSDVLDRLVNSLGKTTALDSNKPSAGEPQKGPADSNEITPAAPPKTPTGAKVEQKFPEEINQHAAKVSPATKTSQAYASEPVVDVNEVLTVVLPEKLSIIQLIGLISEYYHLNYMYDPAKVQGDINLRLENRLEGKLKVSELYSLLEAAMKQKGLVMTRHGNFVTIVPIIEAASVDPLLIDETKGKIRKGDVIVTRTFRLKYIDAESTKNLLTSMGLGVEINTSASAAGFLIVTEYAYRMSRVEEIINMVDKPGEPKKFRFRPLKYIMAAALKSKIEALAEQLGTVSITIASQPGQPTPQPQVRRPVPRPPTQPMPTAALATEAQTVYIDVDERTNRLLMIGRDEQLDIVESLIDILDVEQQDLRSLRLYQIQHADAQDVVAKLEQLGIITTARTGTTTRPSTTRITQPAPIPGAQPSSSQEFTAEEPQVIVIESTNSLLVNATAEQHLRIATIIGYVDSEPEQASTNYAVYPLENQDPEEMAKVLNQLIQETVESKDPTGKVVGTTVTKKTEESIVIIPDKNTFSIIAYASKKNQQWIESLIKQLDKRRPQVLIDVTLVEISKNDEFTFDLDLVTKYPSISSVGNLGVASYLKSPLSLTDPNARNKRIWDASSTAGQGKAFYADNHVQALLTAMDKKGYGRVLAKPKLLVNDNEEGTITTKETQTIVSAQSSVMVGSSGTGSSTASVSKDPYTAEIKLGIKPHISEGDLLRLEVSMIRTDFRARPDYSLDIGEGKLSGPSPPDLLTSDVKTVITVPDNRTIILGGLERLNQTKGGTKVPILGDLPLVGGLFRSTANTDSQNRLYVFVKANILRPEEKGIQSDIVRISDKNRQEFEKREKQMQDYEDWPGIKPTPMEPKKVLDADEK
jgi:general secretion pathway protein D